jgi:hypothetical protein
VCWNKYLSDLLANQIFCTNTCWPQWLALVLGRSLAMQEQLIFAGGEKKKIYERNYGIFKKRENLISFGGEK